MGHVLPRHAQLAVPAARLPVRRAGPARVHGPGRGRPLPGGVRRLVPAAGGRGGGRAAAVAVGGRGPVRGRDRGRRDGGDADGRRRDRRDRELPRPDHPAGRRAAPGRRRAGPLGRLPPARPAAAGRGPGHRHRAERVPDRRGPAPGRPVRPPVGRVGAPGGPVLPRPGRGRLAGRDGPLRPDRRRPPGRAGQRPPAGQPLRDRPGRRPRHRPPPAGDRGHAPVRPAGRRPRRRGPVRPRPPGQPRPRRPGLGKHQGGDRQAHRPAAVDGPGRAPVHARLAPAGRPGRVARRAGGGRHLRRLVRRLPVRLPVGRRPRLRRQRVPRPRPAA